MFEWYLIKENTNAFLTLVVVVIITNDELLLNSPLFVFIIRYKAE